MEVQFEQISKSFKKKQVLDKVNFSLKEGRIYGLLGKNGAGKSTLIHLITQLIRPDRGEILYDGTAYPELPGHLKKEIGLLAEKGMLVEELSLQRYLELTGALYRLDRSHAQRRAAQLQEQLFGDDIPTGKRIASFSTGMKKKAGLCAALLHEPNLLLLDEPFSGLDPVAARSVISMLQQYQRPSRTILITSHNLHYLQQVVSHLIVLDNKSIVFDGLLTEFAGGGGSHLEDRYLEMFAPAND